MGKAEENFAERILDGEDPEEVMLDGALKDENQEEIIRQKLRDGEGGVLEPFELLHVILNVSLESARKVQAVFEEDINVSVNQVIEVLPEIKEIADKKTERTLATLELAKKICIKEQV